MSAGSDLFADAPLLTWAVASDPVSTAGFGTEPGEPLVVDGITRTMWFRVVAPDGYAGGENNTGKARVDTILSAPAVNGIGAVAYWSDDGSNSLSTLRLSAYLTANLTTGETVDSNGLPLSIDFDWEPIANRTYWIQVYLTAGPDIDVSLRVGGLHQVEGDWVEVTPPPIYRARGQWLDAGVDPSTIVMDDQNDKLTERKTAHATYEYAATPVNTPVSIEGGKQKTYEMYYDSWLRDDRNDQPPHPTTWPIGDFPTQHNVVYGETQTQRPNSAPGVMDTWPGDALFGGLGTPWHDIGAAIPPNLGKWSCGVYGEQHASNYYHLPWVDDGIYVTQAGSIGMRPLGGRPVNTEHSLDENYRSTHLYPQMYVVPEFEWLTDGEVVSGTLALDLKRGGPEMGGGSPGDEYRLPEVDLMKMEYILDSDRLLIGWTTETTLAENQEGMAGWVSSIVTMHAYDNLHSLPTYLQGQGLIPRDHLEDLNIPPWHRELIHLPDGFDPPADAKVTCMSSPVLWSITNRSTEEGPPTYQDPGTVEDAKIRDRHIPPGNPSGLIGPVRAWDEVDEIPNTWNWRELNQGHMWALQKFLVRAVSVWGYQPGSYRYKEWNRTTVTVPPPLPDPIADFTWQLDESGRLVHFDASSSTAPVPIDYWVWDFDDSAYDAVLAPLEQPNGASVPVMDHQFLPKGPFQVTLTVYAGGHSASVTQTVDVSSTAIDGDYDSDRCAFS